MKHARTVFVILALAAGAADPTLLLAHMEKVRTGLPGETYVLLGSNAAWPDRLAVNLPETSAQ